MTVEQNLAFGLQQRKTPKAEISRRATSVTRRLISAFGVLRCRRPNARFCSTVMCGYSA